MFARYSPAASLTPWQWGSLGAVGHIGSPQWGSAGTEQELGEVPPTRGGCGAEARSLGSSAKDCKHHSRTSSLTDLGSCCKVKCTTLPSHFPTLESISRSFFVTKDLFNFFSSSTWSSHTRFVASVLRHFQLQDYCVWFPRFVAKKKAFKRHLFMKNMVGQTYKYLCFSHNTTYSLFWM